jgi:hypothetical protein
MALPEAHNQNVPDNKKRRNTRPKKIKRPK